MRDTKSLLLLLVSILLIVASLALLWTWGYHYGKDKLTKTDTIYVRDTSNANSFLNRNDSIQKIYAAVDNLNTIDSALNEANNLNYNLNDKLQEFGRLKNEISELVQKPISKNDISSAQLKIGDLQNKVDKLKTQNNNIEKENQRLSVLLDQIKSEQIVAKSTDTTTTVIVDSINNSNPNSTKASSSNTLNNASFNNLTVAAFEAFNNSVIETDKASNTIKLSGEVTFINHTDVNRGEIMVVITEPDGKTLIPTSWDTGTFETSDGRKIFSAKIKFDSPKGEAKKLNFSVEAEHFYAGTYSICLYQNGIQVSKTTKTLE
jgi:hypothetical protein